ncbi:DUF523 domain-containing protein [Alkaliphilus hydrothermalis]|uniref:Uncharacterized protein YbbK (DUF523 family) n=1 Tax=Alkaliphilus hydrothermalis TaxID=1482730 RepID=A0ABS2NU35_9FIRM|nr:DUF523 domain-containing protein [Alkaliphilus hydrothermalis]MBM7616377.1 uncharacterized protein YbbK (DUF523 family) [Alkaliphilus hydrothermalis]
MILVSACLLGVNCKYTGGNNLKKELIEKLQKKGIVPICPEQLGGLATPRPPAEIQGGDGASVLAGKGKVLRNDGKDVTEEFIKGAEETLKIAEVLGIKEAVLKAKSPSCGNKLIYDGSFAGNKIKGHGVTAALLASKGIKVYSEEDYLDEDIKEVYKED